VVFFCQNNQWAISVPVTSQTHSETLAIKACAYRMPGVQVDGNDVLACYEVTAEAVARARKGGGATFIEALTYRMGAHSTSDDPSRYRDESITEAWKLKDPIVRFRKFLVGEGLLDEASVQAIDEELFAGIRQTLTEVESAPKTVPLASMFEDVFEEVPPFLASQAANAARFHREKPHEFDGKAKG
jgi:pyruvate dehydrogenase E1 component alpha subunit